MLRASGDLHRAVVEIRCAVAERPIDADSAVAVFIRRAGTLSAVSGGAAGSVHAAHGVRVAPAAVGVQYRRVATHVAITAGPGPIAAQLRCASVCVRVGARFVADAIASAFEAVAGATRGPAAVPVNDRRAGIADARRSAIEAVIARPRLAMPRGRTALVFLARSAGASWLAGCRDAGGAGGHRLIQAYRSIGAVRVRVAEAHRHQVGSAARSQWSRSADGPRRAIVPVPASLRGERAVFLTAGTGRSCCGAASRGATAGLHSGCSGLPASSAARRSAGPSATTGAPRASRVCGAARAAAAGDFTTGTA
jgi:hypothetical protein